MAHALTPEEFRARTGVSRETLDRLAIYSDLLAKWNRSINLVSRGSLADIWRRHMLDSAQLLPLAPQRGGTWLDLGSGAGFPGLVLAIMGAGKVHLIESDARKAAFLREVIRATGPSAIVHNARIEATAPFPADVITARALAPLPDLLALAAPFATKATVMLFPKGRDVERELTESAKSWTIAAEHIRSLTDPASIILKVREVSRV